MKQIGVKIIAEDAFGYINTWHRAFENSIESIIESNKVAKDWVGGKILEVYLEFDIYGTYYKVFVDVDKQGLNNILQSKYLCMTGNTHGKTTNRKDCALSMEARAVRQSEGATEESTGASDYDGCDVEQHEGRSQRSRGNHSQDD